jgi:hypothetical protein
MRKVKKSEQAIPLLTRVISDFERGEHLSDEEKQKALQRVQLQREQLFPVIESNWGTLGRMIVYIARFGEEGCEIEEKDISAIGSMLNSIGTVPNLLLMLHSPGGSGETAEKIVDMCRNHCADTFRVIVPNKAKSAATLMAFGADAIVMGYCSELGPIDPQFYIAVGNVFHQVSGLSVIQARDDILKKIEECRSSERDITPYLAQLNTSTMEPAWIRECERQVAFSNDFAMKWVPRYMLRRLHPRLTERTLKRKAERIARNFTSADKRWSHGRMIGPQECQKIGLNVEFLERDNPTWDAIFEIYTRCDNLLGSYDKRKVILTSDSLLVA